MPLRNKKNQVLRIFTNGKRADDAYGLSAFVGQFVRRTEQATKRSIVTVARRAEPLAKREVLKGFNIAEAKLAGKFRAVTTPDSLRLFASDRRFAVIDFGGQWGGRTTPGATARIEASGAPQTFKGAFIASVKGRQSIRERSIRGGKRAGRGPLIIVRGPSPKDMITGLRTDQRRNPIGRYPNPPGEAIVRQLREIYITELQRQIALAVRDGL
jgi:hypothetical protein